MEYVGFDLGKVNSQICLLTEDGELIEKRLKTERETLGQFFGQRGEKVRILIETSTESEWVAHCLEEIGCQVIIADPNFAVDVCDAQQKSKPTAAMPELCAKPIGWEHIGRRTGFPMRREQRKICRRLGEQLVLTRSRYISFAKSLLRGKGLRLNSVDADRLSRKLEAMESPAVLRQTLTPLIAAMKTLDEQILIVDKDLKRLARRR